MVSLFLRYGQIFGVCSTGYRYQYVTWYQYITWYQHITWSTDWECRMQTCLCWLDINPYISSFRLFFFSSLLLPFYLLSPLCLSPCQKHNYTNTRIKQILVKATDDVRTKSLKYEQFYQWRHKPTKKWLGMKLCVSECYTNLSFEESVETISFQYYNRILQSVEHLCILKWAGTNSGLKHRSRYSWMENVNVFVTASTEASKPFIIHYSPDNLTTMYITKCHLRTNSDYFTVQH
jgi:hypothetical protein